MLAEYDGRQVVGIDLHRRRSVLVRMTEAGERLDSVRIDNDAMTLAAEIAKAGEHPQVVVEATYGWYWAVDVLADAGAEVHLAHPLGVKGFAYRRVKNDVRDASDLADLLRMGRLPEGWVAPPPVRELRELVRHRAKLVAWRSALKASVHAVLAKQGLHVGVSDVFGVGGRKLLAAAPLDAAYRLRVNALLRLIDAMDFEIRAVSGPLRVALAGHEGFQAVQIVPGVGPTLAAIFVAEIGDVTRFAGPTHLTSWAGLTPKHRESDTVVHRGPITKQGSALVRWAAVEAAQGARNASWIEQTRTRIAPVNGVVLDLDEAADLARLLDLIEDWLGHADDDARADLAGFLD